MSEEQKQNKVVGLLAEVADQIKSSGPQVYDRLRDLLVEREVASRVDLLDRAMKRRRELGIELNKVSRPDVVTYNGDGTEASGTFTKDRLNARKKAQEAVDKFEAALERALVQNDFEKLKNLVK